jgi:hypothetical protein
MPAYILFRPLVEFELFHEYIQQARRKGLNTHVSPAEDIGMVETQDPALVLRSLPTRIHDLLQAGKWEGEVRFHGSIGDLDLPFSLLSACVQQSMGISIWRERNPLG